MKKTLLLFCLALSFGLAQSQVLSLEREVNFNFISNVFGDVGSSDCWGWEAADGTEYAIVGNVDNVAFVRASDGLKCDSVAGAENNDGYYHRDMVTYGNYCYAVSEMFGTNQGLMIFDLSPLPDSVRFVGAWDNGGSIIRSHNIDIDSASGHLYIEGDGNGGIDIVSIANPEMPTAVGFIPVPGIHDMFARNDTVWVAEGSAAAFSVWDCQDKGNPTRLGRVTNAQFGYCHNIWPSENGRYFVTTEETVNKTVKIWDAADMNNITVVGNYLGGNNLAHNVHVMGDLIFISHYTSGVTVVDMSNPAQPIEIAAYDTYPQNDVGDFYGCWGAFPYTSSGRVYASNFEGKLFILNWDPLALGVEDEVRETSLLPYPSLFSEVTNIPFVLESPSDVSIRVRDVQGKVVADLENDRFGAGSYVRAWRPVTTVPQGIYLIEVQVDGQSTVHRVVKQ